MSQQELLKLVSRVCDDLEIAYFITGSWSSSYLGEPRATHDLDIVIQISSSHVGPLLSAFSDKRFYLSASAMQQAIQTDSMFNLLDTVEGDKVDFWVLTDEPWDQQRFRRREKTTVMGIETYIPSPEDTILAKLRWAKRSGGSEKQMNDARGVFDVQKNHLDLEYVVSWANRLGVNELWRLVVNGE